MAGAVLSPAIASLILFAVFFTLMALRVPVAFALGLACLPILLIEPRLSSMTLLQETVEPERQGRVFGFVGIVMAVSMPLGMAIFGPLADRFTIQSLLVVSGALMFLVATVAVVLPSGRRAILSAGAPAAAG